MTLRQPWHTLHEWEKVDARAVAAGSQTQVANVLEMALQDLVWAFRQLEEAGVQLNPRPLDAPLTFRRGQPQTVFSDN